MTDLDDLRAWLTWATTETHVPAAERAERAPGDMPVAEAAAYMCDHWGCGGEDDAGDIACCLEYQPDAFRDLVLAWAVAVEAMQRAVPSEYKPVAFPEPACPACRSRPCTGTHMSCSLERYLAENPGVKDNLEPLEASVDSAWIAAPPPMPNWRWYMVETARRVNEHVAMYEGKLTPRPELSEELASPRLPHARIASPLRQTRRNPI